MKVDRLEKHQQLASYLGALWKQQRTPIIAEKAKDHAAEVIVVIIVLREGRGEYDGTN